jgi:DNA-directed RNA polymerase subunit M/transcription elongation factor TFIIS
MQPLVDISPEVRLEWIQLISNLAISQKVKYPQIFSRILENEAYSKRQVKKQIDDGVIVYRYGDTDILDIDSSEAHSLASLSHYTRFLSRLVWALHGSKFKSDDPFAWIQVTDEILTKGTLHEKWEKQFYAKQDLGREILAGKGKDKITRGIFPCTRCKSYDVDTEQKQTRSADEPMTIFCTCNVCGQRFVH